MSGWVIRAPNGAYLCPKCETDLQEIMPARLSQYYCRECKKVLSPHFILQGFSFPEVAGSEKREPT
jgi:late competence protein required for DNA uptake (superfamily II DNA/RNA helicase)